VTYADLRDQLQQTLGDQYRIEREMQMAANELRAHGHPAEARGVSEHFVAWLKARPPEEAHTKDRLEDLAEALFLAGGWEEARPIVDTLATRYSQDTYELGLRGRLAAHRGDTREAERVSALLAALTTPYMLGRQSYARAQIAAILGQRERAVALLREAIAQGVFFFGTPGTLGDADPELESLRDYPPFQELLRPKG
jgi:hypothetical protein